MVVTEPSRLASPPARTYATFRPQPFPHEVWQSLEGFTGNNSPLNCHQPPASQDGLLAAGLLTPSPPSLSDDFSLANKTRVGLVSSADSQQAPV